ncbi:MAG TPA: DUF2934 domain-containing protein [Thermodesulfovibrionales bacterium]|jgi:hypothetical protein|nr:DUF2934 domain-containing protein [Thermodesulfovibrionales bacterium]
MRKDKDVRDEVARVAYELYEKRGRAHGYELTDWLEAERIVMERYANEIEKEAEVVKAVRKKKSEGAEPKTAKPKAKKTPPKKTEAKAPKAGRATTKKKAE